MQVSHLPQIHFFFLFFFIFLFFFLFIFPFFLPASGIAGTEVPVFCKSDQNDVVWSLWDIKRCCFGIFILFFKTYTKRHHFGFKSLIQTTSFCISDLKQFQNDVVLNCSAVKKKKCSDIQNDVVLYQKGPKRRHFSCRTLKLGIYTYRTQKLAIFFAPAPIFAQFQAKQRKYTAKHCTRVEEAKNQPK